MDIYDIIIILAKILTLNIFLAMAAGALIAAITMLHKEKK